MDKQIAQLNKELENIAKQISQSGQELNNENWQQLQDKDVIWQQQIKTLLKDIDYSAFENDERKLLEQSLNHLYEKHAALMRQIEIIRIKMQQDLHKQNQSHKAAQKYLKNSYQIEP